MPYAAILFDLDGTLVDTITLYAEAVLEALEEIGIAADPETFFDWYTKPLHLKQILALYGMDDSLVPQVRERRDALYEELLRTRVEWLPGAEALLTDLSAKKVPMAIITGSWMSYVDCIDGRLNLRRFVRTIVTCDDMGNFMKPHPHGLFLACDRLGVDPKACLYIGDQQFDIDAAKAAGMPCWLVRGRWTPEGAAGAGREFGEPGEIVPCLA